MGQETYKVGWEVITTRNLEREYLVLFFEIYTLGNSWFQSSQVKVRSESAVMLAVRLLKIGPAWK